ncbi:MAG TPA: DUF2243 domain-containing protein [Flavobacterium sp.]
MSKCIVLCCVAFCSPVSACTFCNPQIRDGIFNSTFYPNLFTMLSAFIALTIIVILLAAISANRHKAFMYDNPYYIGKSPVALATAATVIGIGVGGFIDGIALHQILQWHEMLSNKIPSTDYVSKSINMFWDGIFHGFCVLVVLVGIILLWNAGKARDNDMSFRLLAGGMLSGWALFNIVEGVIDHHILKLHNVMEFAPDHDIANFYFLGISGIMLIIGWLLMRRTRRSNVQNAMRIIPTFNFNNF